MAGLRWARKADMSAAGLVKEYDYEDVRQTDGE